MVRRCGRLAHPHGGRGAAGRRGVERARAERSVRRGGGEARRAFTAPFNGESGPTGGERAGGAELRGGHPLGGAARIVGKSRWATAPILALAKQVEEGNALAAGGVRPPPSPRSSSAERTPAPRRDIWKRMSSQGLARGGRRRRSLGARPRGSGGAHREDGVGSVAAGAPRIRASAQGVDWPRTWPRWRRGRVVVILAVPSSVARVAARGLGDHIDGRHLVVHGVLLDIVGPEMSDHRRRGPPRFPAGGSAR